MKSVKIKWTIYVIIVILVITNSCSRGSDKKNSIVFGDSLYLKNIPVPPGNETWKFIEDLKSPLWSKHDWKSEGLGSDQTDLSKGVTIKEDFPDPKDHLRTAYDDLKSFFKAGNISTENGEYVIETGLSDLETEAFRLEIGLKSCRIIAGDAEGIRRGIFQLEDEMLRLRSPYLTISTIEKKPFVQRRISRCVYGPIKRPPFMRDELMDEVDYYPDQYLNRLAHDGVNGLWLTVDFRDLVSTKFTPDAGNDAGKRLDKLRKTVSQCLRFGIRTYIFTIEPRAWGNQPPRYNDIHVLDDYPELGGVQSGGLHFFCPISKSAQEYLYEVVNTIFREVPELGGMINISHGERSTTCVSSISSGSSFEGKIDCPRCSIKEPWEVLYASLSAMEKGMHDAAPDAELISWLYHPSVNRGDWVYKIPAHTPEGVILQLNFESGVTRTEFGKKLKGGDYWLSTPGPSENFEQQAGIARKSGTRVSAKLQTGNSHEIASIPYLPVPSLVYRKFFAMHRLGVSHAMLGWFFGNYPGMMINSADELSFEPFPEDEEAFLKQLASIYWKEDDISSVVEAWKYFAEGYSNYPLQGMMGYYGPMHDGTVWPLFLKPVDAPLAPTWLIGSPYSGEIYPPSGDRIGECLASRGEPTMENVLTLKENVELCRRMSTTWDKGVIIMEKLQSRYRNEPERILDIGLAKAIGIQFRSGYNILHFYLLREEMLNMEDKERLQILKQMMDIIKEELEMDEELLGLCQKDSRLGFHSEAEGYKYYPEKIRWRMQQLEYTLANDFPELRDLILKNKLLFPEFTGKKPVGAIAYAVPTRQDSVFDIPTDLLWQTFTFGVENSGAQWASSYDKDAVYIILSHTDFKSQSSILSAVSGISVKVEPRRLWPNVRYSFNTSDVSKDDGIMIAENSGKWYVVARIPFKNFWWSDELLHPLRIDVQVNSKDGKTSTWRPHNPIVPRLVYGTDNSADLGWLVFNK